MHGHKDQSGTGLASFVSGLDQDELQAGFHDSDSGTNEGVAMDLDVAACLHMIMVEGAVDVFPIPTTLAIAFLASANLTIPSSLSRSVTPWFSGRTVFSPSAILLRCR